MALTQSQRVLIEKTRSIGAAKEAEALSADDCAFLIAVIARDLGVLKKFPEFGKNIPDFFAVDLRARPGFGGVDFERVFERLLSIDANADTFFCCLGTLYKARIKYANILSQQPIPTMD